MTRLALIALLAASPAWGQPVREHWALVNSRLHALYGETRQAHGLMEDNTALVIMANEDTGTWSVLRLRADGVTCWVASGTDYQRFDLAPAPMGDDG